MKKLLLPSALVLTCALLHAEEPFATGGSVVISGNAVSSGSITVKADGGGVTNPGRPPAPASGYELRGFLALGGGTEVSLRAPGSTESKWYKVGKKTGDLLVEKADSKAGTATILVDGRRVNLRLAGEAAPAPFAAEEAPKAEDSEADKARKARRERFREMRENATPEQQAEFRRVMREKFEEMRKNNPEGMNPESFNDPEKRKQMGETFRATMRIAAEAAAKLPGKDGKITPVPEDFDRLLIEEGKDMETRAARFRGAAPQAPSPAPEGK